MRQQLTSGSGGGGEKQKLNKSSLMLTQDENEQVFALLGRKCQSLSTGVAQIFETDGLAHSHWKKKHTGVVCFVKDSSKRSYYIRSYCLIKHELSWEHEMYDSIKIIQPRSFLLTFEGQDGHIAINFASDEECKAFHRITELTIDGRNRKRQERRSRPKSQIAPAVPPIKPPHFTDAEESNRVTLRNHPSIGSVQITQQPPQQAKTLFPAAFGLTNSKDKKKGQRKYTKADISTPTNFKHVTHVGWDAQKGFDLTGNEDDNVLKHFFNKAGVSQSELNDRATREFIYDFIQSNNVLASVKSEGIEPKAPAPAPPPVPNRHQPPQNGMQRSAPPPPPARQPPPPVPPNAPQRIPVAPSRPPPIQGNNFSATQETPPPPPPPPPPPAVPMPPPPPPMPLHLEETYTQAPSSNELKPSSLPVVPDVRNELMESIRKGTTLRKVDPDQANTGSRNDLLNQIRQGTNLRPAAERELPSGSNRSSDDGAGTDALADALRRALADRERAIHSSDEDGDTSSDIDGEWD